MLANIVLKSRLISPIHFGAIPGRSAVDAACTLTYDIERAWEQEDILTALAFDIKGAFDAVTKASVRPLSMKYQYISIELYAMGVAGTAPKVQGWAA